MPSKELIALAATAMEERRKELIAQPLSRIYPQLAEAAASTILAALQEPNAEMIKALWSANASRGWPEAAKTCWQAVLTASALAEQSE